MTNGTTGSPGDCVPLRGHLTLAQAQHVLNCGKCTAKMRKRVAGNREERKIKYRAAASRWR